MSEKNRSRQPAGVPVGGEYAREAGASTGVSLGGPAASATQGYLDVALDTYARTAGRINLLAQRRAAEIVREVYPSADYVELEASDQGAFWEPYGDIYGSDGDAVGHTDDLEDTDLAIHLSNLDHRGVHEAVITNPGGGESRLHLNRALAIRVAGDDPAETQRVLDGAINLYWGTGTEIDRLSQKRAAELVLGRFPGAAYLDLDHSDQGDHYGIGGTLLDAEGTVVGETEEPWDSELATVVSNLGYRQRHDAVVTDGEGRHPRLDLQRALEL